MVAKFSRRLKRTFNRAMKDKKIERSGRLRYLYEALIHLLINEGHLITQRTNNFLILNSILFAAYILLVVRDKYTFICFILKIVLSILGVLTCYFHVATISLAFELAKFWRSSIGLIEKDEDFWYPSFPTMDKDLDIMQAKTRYMNSKYGNSNNHTRQEDPDNIIELAHSKPWKVMAELPYTASSPKFFEYWIPLLLGILWGTALCVPILISAYSGDLKARLN